MDHQAEHSKDSAAWLGHDDRPTSSGRRGSWLGTIAVALMMGTATAVFLGPPNHAYVAQTELSVRGARQPDIDAALTRLRSKASLDNLVQTLNLSSSKSFSASQPDVVQLVLDIASGGSVSMADREEQLRRRLAGAITLSSSGGSVSIRVTSAQADETIAIARSLVAVLAQDLSRSGRGESSPALAGMRDALDRAQAALTGFKTQSGAANLLAWRKSYNDAHQLASDTADALASVQAFDRKVGELAGMSVADVIAQPLPDSLEFTGLEYDRERYVAARLEFDRLATALGPLHPRLLAAQATTDTIRKDIDRNLKALGLSLRQQQADAANRLAALKKAAQALADDKVAVEGGTRLAALEAAVGEAQDNYVTAQQQPEIAVAPVPISMRVARPLGIQEQGMTWKAFTLLVGAGLLAGGAVGSLPIFGRRIEEQDEEALAGAISSDAIGTPMSDAAAETDLLAFDDENALSEVDDQRLGDAESDLDGEAMTWNRFGMAAPELAIPMAIPMATDIAAEMLDEIGDRRDAEFAEADMADWYEDEIDVEAEEEDEVDDRWLVAANDRPLADTIREILMANRRPQDEAEMPSLVAKLMEARDQLDAAFAAEKSGLLQDAAAIAELQRLRDDMAGLRDRLETYSELRQRSA